MRREHVDAPLNPGYALNRGDIGGKQWTDALS
jgi:hypothetical protein